jgi:nicotinamidase-related amidase
MTKLRKYTLVIIDMQPYFRAARNNRKLINKIKQEIERAKKLNNSIMLVYMPCCSKRITSALVAAIRGYDKGSIVAKAWTDGHGEILKALPAKTHLRFCGVNTDACVRDTVLSMAANYPKQFKIEVVANGCASEYFGHDNALQEMNKRSNIRIDWAA